MHLRIYVLKWLTGSLLWLSTTEINVQDALSRDSWKENKAGSESFTPKAFSITGEICLVENENINSFLTWPA